MPTGKSNGIQLCTTASTPSSRRLDQVIDAALRPIRSMTKGQIYYRKKKAKDQGLVYQNESLLNESEFEQLDWISKLSRELIPGQAGACQPDGGICYLGGIALLAVEGKTQGYQGNAIERYGDNHGILCDTYPALTHITFCAGEGVEFDGPIFNLIRRELAKEGMPDDDDCHFGSSSFVIVDEDTVTPAIIKDILRPILRVLVANSSAIQTQHELLRWRQEQIRHDRIEFNARILKEQMVWIAQ